jgi:hypothetical protein
MATQVDQDRESILRYRLWLMSEYRLGLCHNDASATRQIRQTYRIVPYKQFEIFDGQQLVCLEYCRL